MQEEVTRKTIALAIKTAKLDGKVLQAALRKLLQLYRKARDTPHRGKQTLKQLMRHGTGVSNIEITDANIKAFESTAKKYGIDFALKKADDRYLVFFKGRDADVLTAAFREFSKKKLDMDMSALPKTNYIKSIVTSECKMDMERKGVQSYQSQLYVRFLCFGNGALTALHDKSDGFFRRQIVLTTKDRPAGRADDPFLVDKLLREKEGIFLWCLEGLRRLIGNNYQFSISGKARENMETVKRSSNNVIEFLQSEGYIRFRADSEASSKAIYEAYTRWCDDNAQKPMSANRVSSELVQNERLYNVEATNNVHVGGKRVRGFVGIEVVNPLPY